MRFVERLKWAVLGLGVAMIIMGVTDIKNDKTTPINFNEMTEKDFVNNAIVEGDIQYNLGAFEEEYTTNYGIKSGSSHYVYMIPVGKEKFMGLRNRTAEEQQFLDDQADKTIDLMLGDSLTEPQNFHFKGRVKPMSGDDIKFFKEYLVSAGYTEKEAEQCLFRYRIDITDYSGGFVELGIGAAIIAIFLIVIVLPYIQQKKKEKYLYGTESFAPSTSSTYENNTYEPPTSLKMPASVVEDDFPEFDNPDEMDYGDENVVEDKPASGGLKLKLKDD